MQAFVPKTRRPKFELSLKIIDLNNVPLACGTSYVKWHLPSSTSAEHRGNTTKALIRDHRAIWDYSKSLPVRLTVDRSGILQECEIHFEILQEYSPGTRAERIVLGTVRLNLSEFVGESESGEDAVTRRYLMQESKVNSTLKICLHMKQVEGDRNFTAPPMKTAPVFGGIAGIMTAESGDTDDGGSMPSMSTKAQESGKLQDLYRRNLAASFAARVGELPADKCIEDIFNGGDGWGSLHSVAPVFGQGTGATHEDDSDGDQRTVRGHQRHASGSTIKNPSNPRKGPAIGTVSGRASIEQQVQSSSKARNMNAMLDHDIDEVTAREDLKSWEISSYG